MANERRVRSNFEHGTITDNPLSAAAITINSAAFANMPAIDGTEHAILVLDPKGINGDPEIVRVIAHTASTTVVTVNRGVEGSTARSHPQGTTWIWAPTFYDYVGLFTSSTRPTVDIYEGQPIYEIDTNKFYMYTGTDWAPRDAGGQLGYAQITAISQSGITTITDLTGLSVTVTIATGRRVRIIGHVPVFKETNEGLTSLYIRESATTLERNLLTLDASRFGTHTALAILSPSAGSHTYKLSLAADTASVATSYDPERPAFILVEDIGAA